MNKTEFTERMKSVEQPVVVDFWATWCAPCRSISPALEKLSKQYEGRVHLMKVNVDNEAELARALGIYSIPTLVVYRGGDEILRRSGAQPLEALTGLFESALSGEAPPRRGLTSAERLLRLGAGTALLILGWNSGPSLLLLGVAGVVLFSAIYDRCPIWQALSPRLAVWLRRVSGQPAKAEGVQRKV
ncbi:MAG: thioredoxin [Chloroflexi bacterium]|nr:thioredoxin [Chloroflexota bacterium]